MLLMTMIETAWHELRLGISTQGELATAIPGGCHYGTAAYGEIRWLLRKLELSPGDTFVDIGAGKGRVLALAAQYPVDAVIGIELDARLADAARANASRLRTSRAPIRVEQVAAERYDYRDVTVAYCFNPVDAASLDLILRKIHASRGQRPFRIAFMGESDAHAAVFASHGWLALQARLKDRAGRPVGIYSTACRKPRSEPALLAGEPKATLP